MLVIKELAEKIREEAKDARKYADASLRAKLDDQPLSVLYAELAAEEMKHAERLHRAAVDLIERTTRSGKEVPPVMRAIWDWEHKILVEEMAEAKHILELARG